MTQLPSGTQTALFRANPDTCTVCGACVGDCPAAIIKIVGAVAAVAPEDMEDCLGCQHCLAVCPTASASVLGLEPSASTPLAAYDPASLDLLIRGRRSVRQWAPGRVDRELLERVLDTVSHAPTGVNARDRRLTVIHDPEVMKEFRDRSCRALVASPEKLPEEVSWLASAAGKWLEKGRDVIFRNAPHIIVATSGPNASTTVADCVIALSYFDLAAQASGIGTVWCGMATYLLQHIPEARSWLGIPEDHTVGYTMLFGMPAVRYARTAQYKPENLVWMDGLKG